MKLYLRLSWRFRIQASFASLASRVDLFTVGRARRLYAFNATETLIRIQNSHDCAKREENKPVCTNCPQLNSHKHLITQVVTHTNRPLQGVVYRHHDDPESKHDIVNLPRKGTGLGVDFWAGR